MSIVSYVRITTANGTVLSGDGAAWAPVSGLSFGATLSNTSTAGSGTVAGKAKLGDLSFALSQSSSLSPQLKQILASGNAVKVEVATYDTSTAAAGSVGTLQSYDVFGSVAAGVGVAALHTETLKGSAADVYTVTPGSVSEAAYGNGAQIAASAFSATNNTAVAPVAAPADVAAGTIATGTAPSQSGLAYYVEFKDASGNYVTGANGSTWFAVSGLSSELEQTLNIGSGASAGVGAGRIMLDPASFTLADASVDPALFAAEASGKFYSDVQIEAVGADGKVVDSTTLGTVGLSSITQAGAPRVTLGYGSYYAQHVAANGAVTGSGWSRFTNATTTSAAADPIVQLNTGSATPAPATTAFVSFTPFSGNPAIPGDPSVAAPGAAGSLAAPFKTGTLIAATGVAFDTEQALTIGSSSTGAGAGKVTFNALKLTVAATPASAVLDSYLFTGKALQQVLLGTATTDTTTEKDDFKLVEVATDALDLVAGTHSLGLEYGGLAEQTAAKAANGALTTGSLQGWNDVRNISDNTDSPIAQGTGSTSASPSAAVEVSAVAATPSKPSIPSDPNVSVAAPATGSGAQASAPTTNTAYVQFRDASGNVITAGPNGASWFKLSSASTALEHPISTGSQTSSAAKVTFDPLSLTLGPNAVTAQLDKTIGTSGGITVELASYGGGTLLNDYEFGGASLTSDTSSAAGSALALSYQQFQETPYTAGAAAAPVTWNGVTQSSAYSATVAAPVTGAPHSAATPAAVATYVEFVSPTGNLVAGSNGKTLFAAKNVTGGPSVGTSGSDPLQLQLGDDSVLSSLQAGLGSTAAPLGVVLVSVNANNPSQLVSYQTYGDVYLTGDTLDNTGGDNTLLFSSDAASGAAYNSGKAPAGYTEQVADDYARDGFTSYGTAPLPSLGTFSKGLPPGAAAAYQSYTGETFTADVAANGTDLTGFVSASNVKVDFAAKTATFSFAASALPALTRALTAGKPVAVSLQSASNNGNTEGLTLGGGSGTAALTGAKLDAATGLADVSVAFTGTPGTYASGSGGGVLGVDIYQDQMVVTPEGAAAAGTAKFDISFTNNLVPTSFDASDLHLVDGSGSTVAGTITGVVAGTAAGTYVATVSGLTGSGPFTVDGTAAFEQNGVANHPLQATDQVGSDVLATDTADGTQSLTVTMPGSPTATTTVSTTTGHLAQTVVLNPDPDTQSVTTTFGPDGTTATNTTSVLTNGTTVVVTPGTATDPAGAGGAVTATYASQTAATPLYTVYQRQDGTLAERVDNTGSGVKTTVYAADGTTPTTITTNNADGTSEVYQALTSGPFASSDDLYDANGKLTRATYDRAGGVTAEVDTFEADGSKTVALYDTTGAPLETTATNADGTSTVTTFEAAGPYASVTTSYDASGNQTGRTEAARAPSVSLSGAGGAVTTPTATVAGSIDIPGVAGTVQLSVNGTATGSPVALNPDGSFSAALPLAANGVYDVTATATTEAGGVGTSAPVEYTVSDIAPTVAFTSPAATSASADRTITGLVTASGTASVAGQAVTLTENGVALATSAPVTVGDDGTFSANVTLPAEGADAIQATVVDSLGNAGSASITETLDQVAPVVSSPTLTVAPGAGPTAVGITAPSDDVSAPGTLTIVVGGLPSDGTLTLADGKTVVTAGMSLSTAQFVGLLFTPTAGLADQTSAFTYTVADGAGNASTGTVTLAIGDPAPTGSSAAPAPSPMPTAPAVSPDPASSSAPALPPAGPDALASVTTANPDGSSTTTIANPDGTTTVTTSGGSRFDNKPYSSVIDTYATDGTLLNEARDRNDGRTAISVYQSGQTLTAGAFDIFQNGGVPETTFVFNPGDGRSVVNLFRVDGTDHDVLSFKGSDFGTTPGAQLASVLSHSKDTAAGLVITDPTASSPGPGGHDKVVLTGITKRQLVTNQADITFHA